MYRQVITLFVALTVMWIASPAEAGEHDTPCPSCQTGFAEGPACCGFGPVCDDCCECPPWLEIQADVLWMGRGKASPQALILADIGGNFFNVLDAADLHPQVGTGVRTEFVIREFVGTQDVEFAYMGVFDQQAEQAISIDPATANLNSVQYQFFGVTGGNTVFYQVELRSDLHSAEFSYRFAECFGFRPLLGVRWIQFNDQFRISELVTPTDGVLGESQNDLIGAQLGAHTTLWNRGGWFDVTATFKAGLYQNQTDLYADTHTAAGPVQVLRADGSATAFAGEIHVTANWHISPHFGLRAGYSGMFLDQIAVTTDQSDNFSLATGAGTFDRRSVSLHGGHVGFELRY